MNTANGKQAVCVSFVGDICLGRKIGKRIAEGGEIFSREVVDVLTSAELVCGNLEAPIVRQARLIGAGSLFACREAEHYLGLFSVLNLANNHILDCGDQGVEETLTALVESGVEWTGIAERGEPIKVARCRANNEEILFVGCTSEGLISARGQSRYVLPAIEHAEVRNAVKELASAHRTVVLLCHAGIDHIPEPAPRLRRLLRECIDAGVAVAVTHHPHVLGGAEVMRAGSITWHSLGDFVFDGMTRLRRRGGILQVGIHGGRVTGFNLFPTEIDRQLCVRLAGNRTAASVHESVQRFGAHLQARSYDRRYAWMFLKSLALFQWLRLVEIWRERGVAQCLAFAVRRVPYLLSYGRKLMGGVR